MVNVSKKILVGKFAGVALSATILAGVGLPIVSQASEVSQNSNTSFNEQIHSVTSANDVNGYEEFTFDLLERGTSVPSSKWDWSSGKYKVDGSSNSATLYTNKYFSSVSGKTFNFTAGSSNRLQVDLIHKGLLVQKVVSTWTIDAGKNKSVTIKTADLDGFSNSDNYYFRFNSSPIGKAYSVSGTFG